MVVDEYLSGRVRQKQEVKLTLKAVIASVRGGGRGVALALQGFPPCPATILLQEAGGQPSRLWP